MRHTLNRSLPHRLEIATIGPTSSWAFLASDATVRAKSMSRSIAARQRRRRVATSLAADAIVNPAKLPRDSQIDVCAQCHGGLGEEIAPAFSFKPGQSLDAFIKLQRPGPDAKVDVHGNQAALLERSRCFQSSGTMACTTCHDEHAPERPTASYSSRCLTLPSTRKMRNVQKVWLADHEQLH